MSASDLAAMGDDDYQRTIGRALWLESREIDGLKYAVAEGVATALRAMFGG